jgi:hypothetical protein
LRLRLLLRWPRWVPPPRPAANGGTSPRSRSSRATITGVARRSARQESRDGWLRATASPRGSSGCRRVLRGSISACARTVRRSLLRRLAVMGLRARAGVGPSSALAHLAALTARTAPHRATHPRAGACDPRGRAGVAAPRARDRARPAPSCGRGLRRVPLRRTR